MKLFTAGGLVLDLGQVVHTFHETSMQGCKMVSNSMIAGGESHIDLRG